MALCERSDQFSHSVMAGGYYICFSEAAECYNDKASSLLLQGWINHLLNLLNSCCDRIKVEDIPKNMTAEGVRLPFSWEELTSCVLVSQFRQCVLV